jgi:N-acetylmuramoyl-L-alanine amidase
MSTIYIHQGHSELKSGSVGANGYKESDFTRVVGERLATKLRELGHTVYLSRERLPNADSSVIAGDANSVNVDFVLSIHANDDSAPSTSGAEAFITGNTQLARDVATRFGELYQARFPGRVWRGVKLQNESQYNTIAILQNTNAPAVLVEAGFLSNAEELQWLQSQAGQDSLAALLCSAITQYV